MKEVLFLAVYLRDVFYNRDKSVTMRLETQELSADQKTHLGKLGGEYLYLALKPEDFAHGEDVFADVKTGSPEKFTKSQKLRQALWVKWSHNDEGLTQEQFYNTYMDKIIRDISRTIDG